MADRETILEQLNRIATGLASPGGGLIPTPTPGGGGAPRPTGGVDLKALARALLEATSDHEHERVLVRYTVGSGKWDQQKRFIALRMFMYTLDMEPDGFHEGVWEALPPTPDKVKEALLTVPPQPSEPLNEPIGPVESPAPFANTKAHWTFGGGDRVYAVGPALSHLVPLANGNFNFSVACSQIITSGTGIFKGVHGLKQSLGTTKAGPDLFDPTKNVPFSAMTVDTFRIVWPNGVPKGFNL